MNQETPRGQAGRGVAAPVVGWALVSACLVVGLAPGAADDVNAGTVSAPTVFYVNDANRVGDVWCTAVGDDSNDGLSSNAPMATVQAVIDRYGPGIGSAIFVDAGVYGLTNDVVLPDTGAGDGAGDAWFLLKGVPGKTVLDRQSDDTTTCGIRVYQDFTRVEGFVVKQAGLGIQIYPGSCRNAKIENNRFYANRGYAIRVQPDPDGAEGVDTYVIANNLMDDNGGGINLQSGPGRHLACCEVRNNTIALYGGIGIVCAGRDGGTCLYNNIISVKGDGYCLLVETSGVLADSEYNDLFAYGGAGVAKWNQGTVYKIGAVLSDWQLGSGMDAHSFAADPLFVSPSTGDYHLRSQGGSWADGAWRLDSATSPCIDAGNPGQAYELEPVDNGGRLNMGAYGNTVEASKSTPKRALYLRAPVGGEVWWGGATQTIAWVASGSGWGADNNVRVEFSHDGQTWSLLSGADALSSSGSFVWQVPNPSSDGEAYYLRVVCNQDGTVFDGIQTPVTVRRESAVYYVNDESATGDVFCSAIGLSTNSGLSPAEPLSSLQEVLSRYRLGPGDTVYVDSGTYALSMNIVVANTHGGAFDAPIRLVGTFGRTTLIRDATGLNRFCLEIHSDYTRVEGFSCQGGEIGIFVNASSARHAVLNGNVCVASSEMGIQVFPTGNASGEEYQILQNVVDDCGGGMSLQGVGDMYNSHAVFVVENNTLRNGGDGLKILNASPSGRRLNLLKNNVIHTTNAQASCMIALKGSLNYSDYNNLYALSGAYVGSLQTVSSEFMRATSLVYWRNLTGQDAHSLSVKSLFQNADAGDLRLSPSSPCVDAGINSYWMFGANDADQKRRISGKSCDMGAFELNVTSSIRLFLQGPFLVESNKMSSALSRNQRIPLKSPFADDPRGVAHIPPDVTDWVLVQFRLATNGPAILSRSLFLRDDGWVVNDEGDPSLDVDLASTNAYTVVVKHRNHLAAMSSSALPFLNRSLVYDFTTSAESYFGGAGGCVAITNGESVCWAVRAGDADGDGCVLPVDAAICLSQTDAVGYHRGDVDLTGTVGADDRELIAGNLFVTSSVPRPDAVLLPMLRISPSRRTVSTGEVVTLTACLDQAEGSTASSGVTSSGSGSVSDGLNWGFVWNTSGATLETNGEAQAVYAPGMTGGATDLAEAWNSSNLLGRAYLNVIGHEAVATAGKALVIAGRKSADDTLWPTTDYLANNAFMTLRYRGFSKENIVYLSPEPAQDVDENGLLDDVDDEALFANAEFAFTNTIAGTDNLFVYLVDHGGNSSGEGYFRLNPSETVTADQLDMWLDALQDAYNTRVTVLLDFCYAGSFLHALTYTGTAERIVIAACGTNQPSYFVSGGLVSFSSAFFSGVLLGYDVNDCYTLAQGAMATYQSAMLDDNGDGVYTADDGLVAEGSYIGPTFVASGDSPVIGEVCGNQVLSSETAATLWIGSITTPHPVEKAWCLIVPPGYNPDPDNPVTDLPRLELSLDETSGRYAVTYDGFTVPGTYSVQFYVQDTEGLVSAPRQAYVAQIGYDDRVILVAGGDTNSASWPAIDYLSQLAYATLRLRLYASDHIYCLSAGGSHDWDGDGTNDVAAVSGLASLQAAIGAWATTNTTDRLTLYFIGEGGEGGFRLNGTECLGTNTLATWVRDFQATNPVPLNVILDFSGAGAFVPSLEGTAFASNYPGVARVVIASSTAGGQSLFSNGGTVSFSQYLLSGVLAGETLGDAYTTARRSIRRVSGSVRQRAQIDDNLNGVPNEKDVDGTVAADIYLGSSFVTGADTPVIGSVLDPMVLGTPGADVTLWAKDMTGMYPVSNVWCTVTPPGFSGDGDLLELELAWNASSSRYEAVCSGFVLPGSYALTFYVEDSAGEISAPLVSEVVLADAYEPDDVVVDASLYNGLPQAHTFHSSTDEDWVRFYVVTNFAYYDIEVYHTSEFLDTVMELYREDENGQLAFCDVYDEEGSDFGEVASILSPQAAGWYWARVMTYRGGTNEYFGSYEFSIDVPVGAGSTTLIVLGLDDVTTGALPSNTTASVSGQGAKSFNGATSVVFPGLTNGTYLVSVPTPTNYFAREDPDLPGQIQSLTNTYYANPRQVTVSGGWFLSGFEMLSSVSVTSGVVRDAWTRAYLGDAQIFFTAASGSLTGTVVDGSVMLTSYRTPWVSTSQGRFPGNIVLGACEWDLSVALAGYATNVAAGAVSGSVIGDGFDLGTIYLVPLDTNLNAIADSWEAAYFPGGGMVAEEDSDGDGLSNLHEYLCGTDPTNAASVLRFLDMPVGTNAVGLVWSVAGGRSYEVLATTNLGGAGAWSSTNGPWEASPDQETMEWSDTEALLHQARFYRVRLHQ